MNASDTVQAAGDQMAIETNPSRELRSQRIVRQAVGRQTTRTTLLCALSLAAGIALGNYFVRQQLQLQQGVVGQLQHEIRGLTSDIQRMELANSRSIARFENTISRLEAAQRFELAGESRITQERLETLERLVQRQVTATRSAQAACLAEFEPYRRKSLSVPVELIAEALDRLIQGRAADLQLLAEELQTHVENEKSRLAILQQNWNLSAVEPVRIMRSRSSQLEGPLPGFPYASPGTNVDAALATPVATAATTHAPAAESATISTPIAEPRWTGTTHDGTGLQPIPDNPPPAPRSMVDSSRIRLPRPYLLSFASGRRVAQDSPSVPTPNVVVVPAPDAAR